MNLQELDAAALAMSPPQKIKSVVMSQSPEWFGHVASFELEDRFPDRFLIQKPTDWEALNRLNPPLDPHKMPVDTGGCTCGAHIGGPNEGMEHLRGCPTRLEGDTQRMRTVKAITAWWAENADVVKAIDDLFEIMADEDPIGLNSDLIREALVQLFNRHVDESNRRVRCDAVLVWDHVEEGGAPDVVGYVLNGHSFALNGRPWVGAVRYANDDTPAFRQGGEVVAVRLNADQLADL